MKPGALPWGSPAPPTCGGDRWGASWDQARCCLPAAFSSFLVQIPLQAALQVSLTWQNPSPCGIQDQNWVHSSADPTKGTDLDHLGSVSARCSDKHTFPALSGDHSQPSGCAEGEAGAHRAQLQSALDASDSASHGGQGDWLCGLRGSGDGRNGAVWLFSPSAGSCIPGGLPMSRAVCRRGGVRVRPHRQTHAGLYEPRKLNSGCDIGPHFFFVCDFTGTTQGRRPGARGFADRGRDSQPGARPGLASVSEAAVFAARRTCLRPGPPPGSRAES